MDDQAGQLQAVLGFSAEELALNRAGHVSDRQQQLLGRVEKTTNVASVMMIVVVLVFVGVAVGVSASSSSQLAPVIAGAVALVVVVMGFSIRRTIRAGARVATARVQHAEGPVKHHVVRFGESVDAPGSGGIRFDIRVGGEQLTVPTQAAMETFTEGAPYRVHFVREASLHVLLSAEPI